jgi:hypothetical protein
MSLQLVDMDEEMSTEGQGIAVRSLTRSILGVEGCARVQGWGLGQMTIGLIIHTDMHKSNNKLVSV